MNSILNRKMEEDTVLEKRENQEHLFPLLWILGFSILSEILLFVMQRLGRSLIEWMQAFVPDCSAADIRFDSGAICPISSPYICNWDSPLCIGEERAASATGSDCRRGAFSVRAYSRGCPIRRVGFVFLAVRWAAP